MMIRRMRVEGGFLNDLDLELTPGLNVLIGPRGSGKTSIIELIRFCLDVPAFTARSAATAEDHVLAVLGADGRVSLELETPDGPVTASRAWGEKRPSYTSPTPGLMPILLSQREIEQIGVDSAGRLRLIDEFEGSGGSERGDHLRSMATSLSSEITMILSELEKIRAEATEVAEAPDELDRVLSKGGGGEKPDAVDKEVQELTSSLDELDNRLTSLSISSSELDRTSEALSKWRRVLETAIAGRPHVSNWPSQAMGPDPAALIREDLEKVVSDLDGVRGKVDEWIDHLVARRSDFEAQQVEANEKAREIRRRLEELEEGLGTRSRRIARLREDVARLASLSDRERETNQRLVEVQNRRREILEELDTFREARFERRKATAEMLNRDLGPEIRVGVTRSGLHGEYASAIEEVLREGPDRMRDYRRLAKDLANVLSPRELVELAEANKVTEIAERADLTEDRASKVAAAIADQGGESIISAPVNDAIELSLLDGKAYKSTWQASTGQRCTVVLPILLKHQGRSLIIDQPEDHLDNRFIVDTVVKAARERSSEDQLIVATHNANIPVLGEATRVIVLGSDGSRGYPVHFGRLDERQTVAHITSLMEGGREAFRRRAEFYGAEWPEDDD